MSSETHDDVTPEALVSMPSPVETEEISEIESAGEVTGISDVEVARNLAQHRLSTARGLAYTLVALLGLSFVFHYGSILVLIVSGTNDLATKGELLSRIFDVWLPVISGLTGSAVTYFLTRDSSSSS